MEQSEAIGLISAGIPGTGVQHWADLGCGVGTFTTALATLLPWHSYIHAVDKDKQHLPAMLNEVSIGFSQLDFTKSTFILSGLDGILMANSFHYVRDKAGLLLRLGDYFRSEQRFVIVEYENRWPGPWVPYPIPFLKLVSLGSGMGYRVNKTAESPSRFGGLMYSAVMVKA